MKIRNRVRLAFIFVVICVLSLSTVLLEPRHDTSEMTRTRWITQQPNSNSPITEFQIPYTNPGPNAIVSAPNHIFWFVEYNTGEIGEFNESSKTFNQFLIPETGGAIPASLSLDSSGRIWFTDQNKNSPSVWVLNATASSATFHRYLTNSQTSTPVFVLADNMAGDVWFTDTTANNIGRVDPATGQVTKYSLPTSNSGPAELALQNGTSYLWITESFTNKVARFDMSSDTFQEFTPSVSLVSPVGIAVDKSGNVWLSEHGASSIAQLIPSNSTFRKYPTTQPSTFKTTAPATIAIDKQGRLWFVEHFGNRVGRLDQASGIMDEFAIPTSGLAYSLLNAIDANGNFWFTEYTANRIGMIPSNATSNMTINSTLTANLVNAGQTVSSQLSLLNTATTVVTVELNATSTFTTYGQTATTEVSLANYSLTLNPNQAKTVTIRITPDSNLPSGLYTAGIVATNGNSSTIGFVFLQVNGNFSLLTILQTYLPAFIVAVAAVLLLASLMVRRRRSRPGSPMSNTKPPIGTAAAIALILFALLVQMTPTLSAKCIGLPPPPPGQPVGPDYVGLGLDVGSLAFFVLVLILILRNRRKNKPSPDNPF